MKSFSSMWPRTHRRINLTNCSYTSISPRLKSKLQKDYPQLVFLFPTQRNKSEIVYAEYKETGQVLDKIELGTGSYESDLEPEQEEETLEIPDDVARPLFQRSHEMRKVYDIALLSILHFHLQVN